MDGETRGERGEEREVQGKLRCFCYAQQKKRAVAQMVLLGRSAPSGVKSKEDISNRGVRVQETKLSTLVGKEKKRETVVGSFST